MLISSGNIGAQSALLPPFPGRAPCTPSPSSTFPHARLHFDKRGPTCLQDRKRLPVDNVSRIAGLDKPSSTNSEPATAEDIKDSQFLTLDNCADEPIHIPGTVQAHGAMLVFDGEVMLQGWSANVTTLLQLELRIGMPLRTVSLPEPILQLVEDCLALSVGEAIPQMLASRLGAREFDCVVHVHCGRAIVEFELRDITSDEVGSFALKAHGALDRLKRQNSVTALLQMATDQVRDRRAGDCCPPSHATPHRQLPIDEDDTGLRNLPFALRDREIRAVKNTPPGQRQRGRHRPQGFRRHGPQGQ